MEPVTDLERKVLEFLSDKMEAHAKIIGEYITKTIPELKDKYPISMGASVCGKLRRKGYVLRIHELNAWRISMKGRDLLNAGKEC